MSDVQGAGSTDATSGSSGEISQGDVQDTMEKSIQFQREMFMLNMEHARANSMIKTQQGIADRVAQT